jgi:hypothetical protein
MGSTPQREAGQPLVEGSNKLPVNYGHDITGKAAGWITKLGVENGSELGGDVEWTTEGDRMLKDGEFRYISARVEPALIPSPGPRRRRAMARQRLYRCRPHQHPLIQEAATDHGLTCEPKSKQARVVTASDKNLTENHLWT